MATKSDGDDTVHPVILSGGTGTRLWPLSRALYPKQLLALHSADSMLQETARRVSGPPFAAPTLICNQEHRFIVAEQLRAIDVEPAAILLEPVGRNTAPAAAAAAVALAQRNADALMLVAPSDHVIADAPAFLQAVRTATPAARQGALVAFGIRPERPETGYGYILRGAPWEDAAGCFRIERFVEKPDAEEALEYVRAGTYDWNSGMFLFLARHYLDELDRLRPHMADACRRAVAAGDADLDFFRLDAAAFAECPSESIDYAVMEETGAAAVVPVDMGWSDVGSWAALWEIGEADADGNVLAGDVVVRDVHRSYVRSDGPLVAVIGLDDSVVVVTDDAVLVTTRERAQEVKALARLLAERRRSEFLSHTTVYRPWGHYQSLEAGDGFLVKLICVKPRAKLSLQRHRHRAEHWVVVAGAARVTRGDEIVTVETNQSTYIPVGMKHRLENPGDSLLRVIEVQTGSRLSEDDIERLDDVYGRR